MSFTDEERAELIGALSRTADMVSNLLDALDILRVALEAGRQPTEGDLQRLREHSALWRRQLEKLRVTAVWIDDRAADEGAVTPNSDGSCEDTAASRNDTDSATRSRLARFGRTSTRRRSRHASCMASGGN